MDAVCVFPDYTVGGFSSALPAISVRRRHKFFFDRRWCGIFYRKRPAAWKLGA
jgi:hypothetical protein